MTSGKFVHTEKMNKRQSEQMKKYCSEHPEFVENLRKANLGIKRTPEQKERQRQSLIGRTWKKEKPTNEDFLRQLVLEKQKKLLEIKNKYKNGQPKKFGGRTRK